jgi:hypothetical protein
VTTHFVQFESNSLDHDLPALTLLLINKRGYQLWNVEEEFRQDFYYFLDQLNSISSSNTLLSAITTSLWMYLNIRSCDSLSPKRFLELSNLFISEYFEKYKTSFGNELSTLRSSLNIFLKSMETSDEIDLTQAKLSAFENTDDIALAEELRAKAYISQAKMLEPMLNNFLRQQIDDQAKTGVKPLARAIYKANRLYQRDVSKILDYLRASVDIPIEANDTPDQIEEAYKNAILPITEYIAKTTPHLGSDEEPEPHILLILNFKGFFCEVRVHFRFFEVHRECMDTMRMLSRLKTKHRYRLHVKEHLLELIADEIEILNFRMDFNLLPDAVVRLTALTDGNLLRVEWRHHKNVFEDRLYKICDQRVERVR